MAVKLESLKQTYSGGVGSGKNTAEIKRSKITADSKSETQIAAISRIKVNKKEPWTGIWKVEKSSGGSEQWGLRQHGNKVVSTIGNSEINGRVKGNRLKGRLEYRGNYYRFDIKISSDGMSFEGGMDCPVNRTCIIKGMRKE